MSRRGKWCVLDAQGYIVADDKNWLSAHLIALFSRTDKVAVKA